MELGNEVTKQTLTELDSFLLTSRKELALEKARQAEEVKKQTLSKELQARLVLVDDLIKEAKELNSSSLLGLLELRAKLVPGEQPLILTKESSKAGANDESHVKTELDTIMQSVSEIAESGDEEAMVSLRACFCDWRSLVREYTEQFGEIPPGSKEVGSAIFKARTDQVLGSLFTTEYAMTPDEWTRLGDLFSRLVPALQAQRWLEEHPDALHIADLEVLLNSMGAVSSQFHREFKRVQDGYKNRLYKFVYELASKKQIYLSTLDLSESTDMVEEWSEGIWTVVEEKTKEVKTNKTVFTPTVETNTRRDSKGRFLAKQKVSVA